MRRARHIIVALAAVAVALPAGATGAAKKSAPSGRSIFYSRALWATINACNPRDQPHTIGIRGSMPGSGRKGETMFMRFRVQYQDPRTGVWLDVSSNADSGFVAVGSARFKARQAGRSFTFISAGQPFLLRGAVTFEWRRGKKVVRTARKATTGGHRSVALADPPGYTAPTCRL